MPPEISVTEAARIKEVLINGTELGRKQQECFMNPARHADVQLTD
jgi:hypothetical protein